MCSRSRPPVPVAVEDRKSTRLNSSHMSISYAVFCLKKKKGLALRLLRPLPHLPLDGEQEHSHFADRWPARIPLLLIPEGPDRLVADHAAKQTRFLIRLTRSGRGGGQFAYWPAFRNDPVPPTARRHKQNLFFFLRRDGPRQSPIFPNNSLFR